jgi:hypothetical protein
MMCEICCATLSILDRKSAIANFAATMANALAAVVHG